MNHKAQSGRSPAGSARVSERVRHALRKESWGRTALQLAWTAGPVTYLALQGGYILGYGESAPPNLFIYFAGYTLIAGVAAIVVRVVYNATHGRRLEEGGQRLSRVLGQLPNTILSARNAALLSYTCDDARTVAASHLLTNPESSEDMIATAIQDLGGSEKLAGAFRRIESYRRQGLTVMVARERALHEGEIARFQTQAQRKSPDLAYWLAERAAGRAPEKERGRRRTEGFLERALAADSEGDLAYLGGGDVQEILSLAVELLAGRRFPLLVFRYRGRREAAAAWSDLDAARRHYRTILRMRNSRLRTTAEALGDRVDQVLPSVARISGRKALLDSVVEALRADVSRLSRLPGRPGKKVFDRAVSRVRLALHRYAELEKVADQMDRAYAALGTALRRYEEVTQPEGARPLYSATADDRQGAWIDEREVFLSERARHTVAREVQVQMDAIQLPAGDDEDPGIEQFRELAVGIVGALEKHLQLYRTEVQQAIELSRGPYFEALTRGLTPDLRAEWVVALVNEVEDDVAGYAFRRIAQLIQYHGLHLDRRTVTLLARRFGIHEDSLPNTWNADGSHAATLPSPPFPVPRLAVELRRALAHIRR